MLNGLNSIREGARCDPVFCEIRLAMTNECESGAARYREFMKDRIIFRALSVVN